VTTVCVRFIDSLVTRIPSVDAFNDYDDSYHVLTPPRGRFPLRTYARRHLRDDSS